MGFRGGQEMTINTTGAAICLAIVAIILIFRGNK